MDSDKILELQSANEKLTERLNNAAKFFREQKAQIETLTKENEELKKNQNVVDQDATIEKLRTDLEIAQSENKQLKDQINSLQYNEESDADVINNYAEEVTKYKNTVDLLNKSIEDLNKQLNEYELKLENSESLITEINNSNNDLTEENEELKKKLEERIQNLRAVENTTNEEIKKLTIARDEWIDKYRKLEAQYKEQEKFESEVINTKVPELEEQLKNYKQKYTDLQNQYDAKDQAYKVLKESYNQCKETGEQYSKALNSYEEDIKTLTATIESKNKAYEVIQQTYNELFGENETLKNKLSSIKSIINQDN